MSALLGGWAIAVIVLVAATLAAPRRERPWAGRALTLLIIYLAVLAVVGWALSQDAAASSAWAPVVAAGAVVAIVQPLVALGVIDRADLGLAAPRPGTSRTAVMVTVAAVALHAVVLFMRGTAPAALSATIVAASLLAAVLEELVFRGVLLGLLDRGLPARWTLAGARIGWGGVAITAAFIALQGLRPGPLLGVVPAAVLYLWLRAHTGSVLAPIAAHLAWNTSVLLVYA
jgi:membrane protease YdiL (CAAX protease family)